jgi:hypothetical protein
MKEAREPLDKAPFLESTNSGQKNITTFDPQIVSHKASKTVSQADCI